MKEPHCCVTCENFFVADLQSKTVKLLWLMEGEAPPADPAWKSRKAVGAGDAFFDPIGGVDVAREDQEADDAKTWSNLEYGQVKDAMKAVLREREARDVPLAKQVPEEQSAAFWQKFYEKNAEKFFKDRHYMERDYPELEKMLPEQAQVVEVGCGAGNSIWPFLEKYPLWKALAFDCSERAVALVQEKNHPRVQTCVWDVARSDLPLPLPVVPLLGQVDFCLCVFVLSAIPSLQGLKIAVEKISLLLRSGGVLLVRDYGRYDLTEVRFAAKKNRRIAPHVYQRSDGTIARFFKQNELDALLCEAGFDIVRSGYECRELRNRKTRVKMYRCWVSGLYKKK